MPSSSRPPIESSRGRTEARRSGSDRPARTPLHIRLPLPQRAEITENIVARNEGINTDRKESEAEPVQVNQDWKMRSPSPVELTYAPAYFHQLYEDTDIVMASPTDPPRSPTPEQVQDFATLGSYSDTEPPSPTPTEVLAQDSSTWGASSSWGTDPPHSPASKEAQDSGSWGVLPVGDRFYPRFLDRGVLLMGHRFSSLLHSQPSSGFLHMGVLFMVITLTSIRSQLDMFACMIDERV